MATTTHQKPIPDTRYAKQGAPQGDFAPGERIGPDVPEIDDFASGERTLPASNTTGDFASGEHTLSMLENPVLVDTLPPVVIDPDKKE